MIKIERNRPVECGADGIFGVAVIPFPAGDFTKIDRSTSIVSETEKIVDCRNPLLKSRAQISDGPSARCLSMGRKICAAKSAHYDTKEQSSGSEAEYCGIRRDRMEHQSEASPIDSSRQKSSDVIKADSNMAVSHGAKSFSLSLCPRCP